jgi:hypothetical protein
MHACLTYSANLPWRLGEVYRNCYGHRFEVIAFNRLGWAIVRMTEPFLCPPVTQKFVPCDWCLT